MLKDILFNDDSSGRLSKENFIIKNYPDLYNEIIKFCIDNNLDDLPFKQKVYHYKNDIKNFVICKNPYCNNLTNYKNSTLGYNEYCSKKCMNNDISVKEKRKITNIERYGTKTPAECDIVKNKIIKTNNILYGCNSPLQNELILKKSKDTLFKNYGVDNPNKNSEILKKRVKSFMKNLNTWKDNFKSAMVDVYGVEYPLQSDLIKKKLNDNVYEKYNTNHPMKSIEVKKRIMDNIKDKYGVDCVLKCKDIKLKSDVSNIEKYGVDNVFKVREIQDRIQEKLKEKRKLKTLDYYKDLNIIDIDNNMYTFHCDCNKDHNFSIDRTLLKNRIKNKTILCTVCNPNGFSKSGLELQLLNFIKNNYEDEILHNKYISGDCQLDIYLPDLKIAFEFNGLYWHNELNKSNVYHLNKTELCEKKDIQLIHIYEDDWLYKQEIVRSMILNKLRKISNKIYARKCDIKEIKDNKLVKEFLENNHIQGYIGSKIKLGLYFRENLVSLMTFGKKRMSVGKGVSKENEYEMLRFCSKLNVNVIGGASRLFKYFINNYDPMTIVTYADRSWSLGKLYYNLGFNFIHNTNPNYYYIVDGIRYHRFMFRKDVLIKQGYDSNKTEHEIMMERGFYRIFDSGSIKFIYYK